MDNTLVVIPARGGSKRLPHKNSRLLNGKPLIQYSIEAARHVVDDRQICVSTDSAKIKELAEGMGLSVPFLRPAILSTDTASSRDVVLHALHYFTTQQGNKVDKILLLQPTSPFRTPQHLKEAIDLFSPAIDMVVSVKRTKANPYFTLFEMNTQGFLEKSKPSSFIRFQDCPPVYELNGSVYVINPQRLIDSTMADFRKVVPYPMGAEYSLDIDTDLDWHLAECMANYLRAT